MRPCTPPPLPTRRSSDLLPLGGGNSRQKAAGIEDSPDLVFSDLTDWSVVESNGFPDYRYNDREIIRAFADHSASTLEWLRSEEHTSELQSPYEIVCRLML